MKKQERRFRGVGFLVFHFLSKGLSREDSITGEGGFPFCKTEREYRKSEFSLESSFSSWKRKVGVPWASVVFLSPLYMYMYLYLLGFHE